MLLQAINRIIKQFQLKIWTRFVLQRQQKKGTTAIDVASNNAAIATGKYRNQKSTNVYLDVWFLELIADQKVSMLIIFTDCPCHQKLHFFFSMIYQLCNKYMMYLLLCLAYKHVKKVTSILKMFQIYAVLIKINWQPSKWPITKKIISCNVYVIKYLWLKRKKVHLQWYPIVENNLQTNHNRGWLKLYVVWKNLQTEQKSHNLTEKTPFWK